MYETYPENKFRTAMEKRQKLIFKTSENLRKGACNYVGFESTKFPVVFF